jgi:hypothetical protein
MTPIAPHLTAFVQERLPVERGASVNTCDSYAYAFKLLLQYASDCLKVNPSQLQLEQLDAPLILSFLKYLETARQRPKFTEHSAGSHQVLHALPGVSGAIGTRADSARLGHSR